VIIIHDRPFIRCYNPSMWYALVLLLLAAGVDTPGKTKSRNWQAGEVRAVVRPGETRPPAWGPIGPHITTTGNPDVLMLESSSFDARWTAAVAFPDARHVISFPPPPPRSSLAALKAGVKIECAVEGKTMYLKDAAGAIIRAKIRQRAAP
jgi:hypothetical protein